jgi:hypothetical protein
MSSPFPGMDPYLEDPAFWPDVHGTLVTSIRAAITKQLPPGYFAELDQHVWLEEEDPVRRQRRGRPDVYITSGGGRRTKSSNGHSVIAAPTATVKLPTLEKIPGPRFIRIMSMRERRVVTAIELLSPSNKKVGADQTAYLVKRNDYLSTDTNLVEVDLLRAGTRLPIGNDKLPDTDYYVYVTRGPEYTETDVWAFTVRDPFPVFPIPLAVRDHELSLDLKPCLDRTYDEANYGPQLDYSAPPVPPLRKPDAEWAAELLNKHAKKSKK